MTTANDDDDVVVVDDETFAGTSMGRAMKLVYYRSINISFETKKI
jgi:orotate phosphoribosyltransferase